MDGAAVEDEPFAVRGSLLGRADERAGIADALGSARLVTLVGAPGIGKTRLARAVGDAGAETSVVVELAAVSDPALVESALTAALSVRMADGLSPMEAIVAALRRRRLLLVLDNCEHLLDVCAQLAGELLAQCAQLTVLATSREPLGVAGELVWRVPPLGMPDESDSDVEALMTYPAVALFVQRAAEVWPGFTLNPSLAVDVADICRRLDGIPLAIELAAARVATMTPREIARRLEDQIGLPAGEGDVAGEPRHRTLVSAIDWSHALLAAPERSLLHGLSVFVGTFELDAVTAVCGDEVGSAAAIPRLLARLVSKSLVMVVPDGAGGRRYRLLETVRAYAAEKLQQAGRTGGLRTAHASFYVSLAERAEPEFAGPRQLQWFDRIAAERPNLRAALEWSLGRGRGEWALRMAGALVLFWRVRGPYAEGHELLGLALSADAGEAPGLRAKALWGAGFLRQMAGDASGAAPLLEESLRVHRALGDDGGCARVQLIRIAASGDPDPASHDLWLAESVRLARAAGDDWCLAHALGKQGMRAAVTDGWRAARSVFRDCLAVATRAGDLQGLRFGLIGLGRMAVDLGEYSEGQPLLAEAVEVTGALGETYDQAVALTELGRLSLGRGEYSAASRYLEQALAMLREHEPPWAWLETRVLLATVAHAEGDRPRAREMLDELSVAVPDSPEVAFGLATLAVADGDPAAARELLERAAHAARGAGWGRVAARVLNQRALLASEEGDTQAAAALHDEALALQLDLGDVPGIAQTLEDVAGLAAAAGHHEHAARLFGAAEALRQKERYARLPWDAARYGRDLARVRAAMPGELFRRASADGAAMTVEQAVTAVLAGPHPARAATGWQSLTERELEIASLVADGLSNPEIAGRMFIARETVKTHLANIFAKLGVNRRSMLALEVAAHRDQPETAGPGPNGAHGG